MPDRARKRRPGSKVAVKPDAYALDEGPVRALNRHGLDWAYVIAANGRPRPIAKRAASSPTQPVADFWRSLGVSNPCYRRERPVS